MGDRNIATIKQRPVISAVKPVLPPAATPAEDSTNVVTVEVPNIAPVVVATASASMHLFMLRGLPFLSKSPPLEQAPYSVPRVSNISSIHSESAEVIISRTREPTELPASR